MEQYKKNKKIFFVGIDPGIKYSGIATIDINKKILNHSKIDSKNLLKFANEVEKILKKYKPLMTAVENVFTKKSPREAFKLCENRGVVIFLLEKNKLNYINVYTQEWKKALTGYGKAKSYQVKFMLKKFLKGSLKDKISEHELDALSLAYFALTRCSIE
ncbi:MAG: crossover junction endodeoxyribonuclease RuvC [Candidatus Hydrothermales bacterium]